MGIFQLIAGLLIAGESLVLFFVMHLKNSSWVNPVNTAYVVIDVIVGLILLASAFDLIPAQNIILITSTLIHIYRDYEVFQSLENRYAFNTPLLLLLNIRLLALVYIILNN